MAVRVWLSAVSLVTLALTVPAAWAQDLTVDLHRITAEGIGEKLGTVAVSSAAEGVSFQVMAQGLPAGEHGFHVHEKGDCGPGVKDGKPEAGLAAGDHYDPGATGSHQGPDGAGHEGDLPKLVVAEGSPPPAVVAKRLTLAEIRGRAVIVHEGGDSYSDQPPSGGGQGRIACAVIPAQ